MAALAVTHDRPHPRPGPVSPWSFLRFVPAPQQLVAARLRRHGAGGWPLVLLEERAGAACCVSYLVALAVGRRRRVPMRLEIEGWSAAVSRVELVPLRRVRPTRRYVRAGHRFLDAVGEVSVPG